MNKKSLVISCNVMIMQCILVLGMYCSGWVKTGPVGVIVSTMNNAFETGKVILDDLASGELIVKQEEKGKHLVMEELNAKGKLSIPSGKLSLLTKDIKKFKLITLITYLILWTMQIKIKRKKMGISMLVFKIQLFIVAHHSHNSRNSLVIKQCSF